MRILIIIPVFSWDATFFCVVFSTNCKSVLMHFDETVSIPCILLSEFFQYLQSQSVISVIFRFHPSSETEIQAVKLDSYQNKMHSVKTVSKVLCPFPASWLKMQENCHSSPPSGCNKWHKQKQRQSKNGLPLLRTVLPANTTGFVWSGRKQLPRPGEFIQGFHRLPQSGGPGGQIMAVRAKQMNLPLFYHF